MTQTPTTTDGFDIIITKGSSDIYDPSPEPEERFDPTFGEEPSGPSWNSVRLDIEEGAVELNGYRYAMSYWKLEEDLEGGNPTKVPWGWKLVSQTIVKKSPSRQVFTTDLGTELFPIEPQTITVPLVGGSSLSTQGGITDGTKYDYLRVFNQAELSWLPRCSTINTEFVEDTYLPSLDVDPDLPEPKYPMDALSAFVPDDREEVTITYEITTTYKAATPLASSNDYGPTQTHTFTITQKCTQEINNLKDKIKAALNRCYFTHGFTHIQLYDNEAPANYDSEGNQIGEVIEPIYKLDEERTEMVGYDVYQLVNSVWSGNDETDLESIKEEEDRQRKQIEEMMIGMDQLIENSQKEYESEFEAIEKANQEYAELISENQKRRQKLIDNLASQQGTSYKELFLNAKSTPITPDQISGNDEK
jgi:hypothetical protein